MKSLLVFAFAFCMSASAWAVTSHQRATLRTAAYNVMIQFGAELDLSPEVSQLQIVNQQGSVVEVEFQGIEWGPYEYNCNFAYDFSAKSVIAGSESCK